MVHELLENQTHINTSLEDKTHIEVGNGSLKFANKSTHTNTW